MLAKSRSKKYHRTLSRPNKKLLKEPMGEFVLAIIAGDYAHDEYDLVDALILPVFMLQEAVSYIETVV